MIGLHACEEQSTHESLQPPTRANDRDTEKIDEPEDAKQDEAHDELNDAPQPPIVEERLLVCIDTLKCLQQLARLAQQTNNIPQFSSLFRFARMTNQFARAIEGHIRAVTLVLPVTATDLPAPDEQERV